MTGFRRNAMMVAVVVAMAGLHSEVSGQAPPISDPDGMAQPPAMPGTFPQTVTSTNVKVEQLTPAELSGPGSDSMRVSFPAAGPIKWTESRHNEGDIALSIGPFDPNDPAYFPPNSFIDNYRPIADGQPFEKTTLAWRLNQQTGAALATVNHNGVDYGPDFTYFGSPVGTIHGIAYFNQGFAQGWGYRMNDGVFANGGEGSPDLQMGIAGFDDFVGEANTSFAAAYFPYEQGWIGAWVNGGDDGEATFAASSPGLPASTVNWTAGSASVVLPGVNSASDGMLFVAPTHSDNPTNIAAAFPSAGGWTVTVREDETFDPTGTTISLSPENQFQFLYVPYSATNLIGGHVQGSDGSLINAAGDNLFDLARNEDGEYALSVYDSDGTTKLTENDGMLILSVAGAMEGAPTLADRAFISYEYDPVDSGDFIIQTRRLAATNSPNSENQFGDWLRLEDANFYFAWVDFASPLAPPSVGIPGDYNENGTVDAADYVVWRNAGPTDTLPNDPTPGTVDESDYNFWKANFGMGAGGGAGQSLAAVPEPASALLATMLAAVLTAHVRRRQRRRTGITRILRLRREILP